MLSKRIPGHWHIYINDNPKALRPLVAQLEAENERLRGQIMEKNDSMLLWTGDLMRLEKEIREALGGET